jgi:hypothetical protein
MIEGINEITGIVERLELLEEKFGITISALYAKYEFKKLYPNSFDTCINFDVTSLNGDKLRRNVFIKASVYNSTGQLLRTAYTLLKAENFIGFSSVSLTLFCDQEPVKIRLFPSES